MQHAHLKGNEQRVTKQRDSSFERQRQTQAVVVWLKTPTLIRIDTRPNLCTSLFAWSLVDEPYRKMPRVSKTKLAESAKNTPGISTLFKVPTTCIWKKRIHAYIAQPVLLCTQTSRCPPPPPLHHIPSTIHLIRIEGNTAVRLSDAVTTIQPSAY